eukprot:scaffold8952_cov15-Tisochrysis_lutea.AAC.2
MMAWHSVHLLQGGIVFIWHSVHLLQRMPLYLGILSTALSVAYTTGCAHRVLHIRLDNPRGVPVQAVCLKQQAQIPVLERVPHRCSHNCRLQ